MRFNSIPMDQPGRYFYFHDQESRDFWSSSWQPVGKPLDDYKTVCRHGTAYTVIESEYSGIKSESTYFVPLNQDFEYWLLKISNNSGRKRKLSVFTYCEFSNTWDTSQDLVNLQYSLFITRGTLKDGLLSISTNDHFAPNPDGNYDLDESRRLWMTLQGASVVGFDTSRDSFLGSYRSYDKPLVVEKGMCSNSNAYGDNTCGTLQTDIILEPGESKELVVLLGLGDSQITGKKIIERFSPIRVVYEELDKLKKSWHSKLESFSVETPDKEFDSYINMWAPYNSMITFAWSRAASLVYNGERDGLGFRDSVQDVLGVALSMPDLAKQRLELMLSGQLAHGGAIPVIKPFDHHPGKEHEPPADELRSDDCLWFFNAIPEYVAETGNIKFYETVIPYADKGQDTVFGHMRRALEFNLSRLGKNRLPCGLSADWNDCLKLGYYGESVFVAFQVRLGLSVYADIADSMNLHPESKWARSNLAELDKNIQKVAWDGNWFIWAIGENGQVYGTKDFEEGQVYLNTQVWSILSGFASKEQAQKSMQTVKEKLATPYGVMLSYPPFEKTSIDVMRAVLFLNGIKENSGIFGHTQGWAVMAEALLKNGNQAYSYYRAAMPTAYNEKAEIRQAEPYVQTQTTYSTVSERPGNSRVSWLTGAAAWMYFSATHYILGIQPEIDGLKIDPCIPSQWDGFKVNRIFRGKKFSIVVSNPSHVSAGVKTLTLNGRKIEGNRIPVDMMQSENVVAVLMG